MKVQNIKKFLMLLHLPHHLVYALDYRKVYVILNNSLMAQLEKVCSDLQVNPTDLQKLSMTQDGVRPWRRNTTLFLKTRLGILFHQAATEN
jgi:hypothetical protein